MEIIAAAPNTLGRKGCKCCIAGTCKGYGDSPTGHTCEDFGRESDPSDALTPALISHPEIIARILRAKRESGLDAVQPVADALEPLIAPCEFTQVADGDYSYCVPSHLAPWPGPITAAHREWLSTCPA